MQNEPYVAYITICSLLWTFTWISVLEHFNMTNAELDQCSSETRIIIYLNKDVEIVTSLYHIVMVYW